MKWLACSLTILLLASRTYSQNKLYIQFVSHNEPNDNLQSPLNYQHAKSNLLQMAHIIDSADLRWNLQTSDGLVFGARTDQQNTNTNIFKTLALPPYSDNIEIDPRPKNMTGYNIADQWFLLDSLGANPTKTVGGFIYNTCPPNNYSLIDWWPFEDTITGIHYGNKVKFTLLSGAGSLPPHCNDLKDFGIFKPDTVTNFYSHNPSRNLWCVGVGCAHLLDSMSNEQEIIDLIQAQADSVYSGLWPSNRFYVTRIMTNQREYGPLFFQKVRKVVDSLVLVPSSKLKWATISGCFQDFQTWTQTSGNNYSMWQCGQTVAASTSNTEQSDSAYIYPNPIMQGNRIYFKTNFSGVTIMMYDLLGNIIMTLRNFTGQSILLNPEIKPGTYLLRINTENKPMQQLLIEVVSK